MMKLAGYYKMGQSSNALHKMFLSLFSSFCFVRASDVISLGLSREYTFVKLYHKEVLLYLLYCMRQNRNVCTKQANTLE